MNSMVIFHSYVTNYQRVMMEKKTSHQISRMFYGNWWEIPGFGGSLRLWASNSNVHIDLSAVHGISHRVGRRLVRKYHGNSMDSPQILWVAVSLHELLEKNLNFDQVQLKCHDPEILKLPYMMMCWMWKNIPKTTHYPLGVNLQGAVGLDVGCCGHWQIRGQDDLGLDRRMSVMSFGPSKTTWIKTAETQKKWSFCGWTSVNGD